MRARKPWTSGKTALAVGLTTALAALGLGAGPLTTASAQNNSRVCGIFWYTQVPDPTNDNKPTWFTLGMTTEIDKDDGGCNEDVAKESPKPNLESFRKTYPDLPESLDKANSWTAREIDKVTCEDFATHIAQPPNGEEITGRGQNWPVDDPDPCQSWTRNQYNRFWFKHL